MGIALWAVSGFAAAAIGRLVAEERPQRWIGEAFAAILSALVFGVAATALDFGGWRELDWRAGLFAFCGAAIAIALVRLTARADQ